MIVRKSIHKTKNEYNILYKELLDMTVNFQHKSGLFPYLNILFKPFRITKKPLGIIKKPNGGMKYI